MKMKIIDTQMSVFFDTSCMNAYILNAYTRHLIHYLINHEWKHWMDIHCNTECIHQTSQTSRVRHLGSAFQSMGSKIWGQAWKHHSELLARAGQPFGPGAVNIPKPLRILFVNYNFDLTDNAPREPLPSQNDHRASLNCSKVDREGSRNGVSE